MGNANNKSKKRLKSVMAEDTSSEKKRRPKKYKIEEKDKNISKSLSDNKLIKLPYNENNHEEALPNSLDTNFSSTKSNTNEALEEEEFEDLCVDDSYETHHGISLSLQDGSVWNVTEESVLSRLTVGEGCTVNGVITVDGETAAAQEGEFTGNIVVSPAE